MPSYVWAENLDLSKEEMRDVVDRIAELFVNHYVFSDVGQEISTLVLEKLENGDYDRFSGPEEFSTALTEDLRDVNGDKHIRVSFKGVQGTPEEPEDPLFSLVERVKKRQMENFGFEHVQRLEGNVGYLVLREFSSGPEAMELARSSMKYLAHSDAYLIDVRENGGGGTELIEFICGHFFEGPTQLSGLYWRRNDRLAESWTKDMADVVPMPDVPLFVLVNGHTFSAAEAFAYDLQTYGRAKIVGETTVGGANPGGTFQVGERFSVFIPTGRAVNPVTGTNWDGVGVVPDITVEDEEAFEVAYTEARRGAEVYRDKRTRETNAMIESLHSSMREAKRLIGEGDAGPAEASIASGFDPLISSFVFDERAINDIGYYYLGEDDPDMAVVVFRYNVKTFPESYNVFDSLGEAYMIKGEKELAIYNYEKSLELNPHNDNAVRMLKELREEGS
jgi:hypothetical protein